MRAASTALYSLPDTALVGKALTDNLSDGWRNIAQTLIGSGLMVYLSPKLAVVVLSVIPPLAIVGVIFGMPHAPGSSL